MMAPKSRAFIRMEAHESQASVGLVAAESGVPKDLWTLHDRE